MNFFAAIGRAVLTLLAQIGRLACFTGRTLASLRQPADLWPADRAAR